MQKRTETPQPTFEVISVTPAMAREWLGHNTNNRNVRPGRVARYASDMRLQQWALTGEPIKRAPSGELLDGQHRLLAVIEANISVTMVVARNIPASARASMDTGVGRQAADQLRINGHAHAYVQAAAAKWLILFHREELYIDRAAQMVTHADIVEFCRDNNVLLTCAQMSSSLRQVDLSPGTRAACLYLCMRVDASAAVEFFARLNDGAGLDHGSPILALRSRLREIRLNRTKVPIESLMSITIRAWNAWRSGNAMASIPTHRSGQPIRCPKPI